MTTHPLLPTQPIPLRQLPTSRGDYAGLALLGPLLLPEHAHRALLHAQRHGFCCVFFGGGAGWVSFAYGWMDGRMGGSAGRSTARVRIHSHNSNGALGICNRWNCTCDRRVRAVERADYTTVIGAVILLNEGGQWCVCTRACVCASVGVSSHINTYVYVASTV